MFVSLCLVMCVSTCQKRPAQGVTPPKSMVQGSARKRQTAETPTLFGFTPFPYDNTLEALTKTRETIAPQSTLWALHYDDGIPWKEALADAPFPVRIRNAWAGDARAIPPGHVVYVGLAPLDKDRKSLAPALGEAGQTAMPDALKNAPLDDPNVEKAYLNYARRAVSTFHPRYLNLGIEAGQLLARDRQRWPQFERLYDYVRSALKKEFPEVQMGISFGLGDLRSEQEAKSARSLIANSDYVGLSFYPYASDFDEKFGAPPYRGEAPWRSPLAWIRAYTDKPIALCETGYSTQDIAIPAYHLNMAGTAQAQTAYTRELFEIAKRDHYAFVVWFLAIDYDKLYARMPAGSDVMKLWRNIGFLDGDLHPKPAWEIWKAGVKASRSSRSAAN